MYLTSNNDLSREGTHSSAIPCSDLQQNIFSLILVFQYMDCIIIYTYISVDTSGTGESLSYCPLSARVIKIPLYFSVCAGLIGVSIKESDSIAWHLPSCVCWWLPKHNTTAQHMDIISAYCTWRERERDQTQNMENKQQHTW